MPPAQARHTRTAVQEMGRILDGRALRRRLTVLEPDSLFFGCVPRPRAEAPRLVHRCREAFRQAHGFMEGWTVLSGHYRLGIGDTFAMMGRGDCLVLPPYVAHAHYVHPRDTYAVLGWTLLPLSVDLYLTRADRCSARRRTMAHHLLPRSGLPEAAVVEHLSVRAARWSRARLATHAGQSLAMLFAAAATVLNDPDGWSNGRTADEDVRVEAIVELIDKDFHQDLSLGQISRAVGLSPAYCCDVFSRHKGVSPIAYLSKVRLDAACRLLVTTDVLVKQVAARTGFHDANYFVRRFRRAFGLTPLAYREKGRAGPR